MCITFIIFEYSNTRYYNQVYASSDFLLSSLDKMSNCFFSIAKSINIVCSFIEKKIKEG